MPRQTSGSDLHSRRTGRTDRVAPSGVTSEFPSTVLIAGKQLDRDAARGACGYAMSETRISRERYADHLVIDNTDIGTAF